MKKRNNTSRIELLDAIRGLAVVLMVLHHLLYDLYYFCNAPYWIFSNPVLDALHYFFAGLFILISGISSNFSRSNVKRGLKTLALALCVTLATWAIDNPAWFGILHCLGCCMVLYGLTRKFWDRLPDWFFPAVLPVTIAVTACLANGVTVPFRGFFWLGFCSEGFSSSDYFPLLPWLAVFLLGTWVGKYIKAGKLPDWFYRTKAPRLAAVGRLSLWIFIAHQPVLFGLIRLIQLIF